jgi:hypothetical protein
MKTNRGKLRNITTGILHTKIQDVYEFFENYTGIKVWTHELPAAQEILVPFLKTKIGPSWFVNKFIPEENDYSLIIPDLTEEERKLFYEKFEEARNNFFRKNSDKIIAINLK